VPVLTRCAARAHDCATERRLGQGWLVLLVIMQVDDLGMEKVAWGSQRWCVAFVIMGEKEIAR
jgi:hypothetical protein